ncbi:uncharacterized protein BX663DRAFT_22805 [Cokeromyces recurvatus]|uniref:uncharacterized protein n=1 Tax=Cokeromyces recurvatus TaxID=90255 RepID=UPI002220CAB0|nr:uncharacterized protein BX663DRAFT_22805 [Cokeromyces recurvatus]KAI7908161.1 hypothetical protein BX663DRAFT_22805 [Cokeromyces recurvatus]
MARPLLFSKRTLTLDDFLQLQSLLNYERQERDNHIQVCNHYQQQQQQQEEEEEEEPLYFHHPFIKLRGINPQAAHQSQVEKQRLEQALIRLKYLKDQYRRQRAAEIQAYLEAYRRQALICAAAAIQQQREEEEERYYRQCIAAALEQKRVNALWQNYLNARRQQALLQKQFEKQHLAGYRDQNGDHMTSMEDKTLFPTNKEEENDKAKEEEEEEMTSLSSDDEEEENDEQKGYSKYHSEQLAELLKQVFGQNAEEENFYVREQPSSGKQQPSTSETDDEKEMADVWKYISDQKLNFETPRSEQKQEEEQEEQEEEEEESLEGVTSASMDNGSSSSDAVATNIVKPKLPTEITKEEEQQQPKRVLPPLQDHVVTLQDLIQQLASEPVLVNKQYMDEPKPSGIWASREEQQRKQKPHPIDAWMNKKEEEEGRDDRFLPKQIFTEAEPTPTREQVITPLSSVPSFTDDETSTKNEQAKFVDSVAIEQQQDQPTKELTTDPRKEKANKELDTIAQQLDTDSSSTASELVQRWKNVLKSKLSFTKQPEGTFLLTASTDANRQFLGSEDELMRVMLKLDSIDSLGDDDIRQKRRGLVKKCEHMLDELDQLKKSQWEKIVTLNKKKNKHNKHRHRHHKKQNPMITF